MLGATRFARAAVRAAPSWGTRALTTTTHVAAAPNIDAAIENFPKLQHAFSQFDAEAVVFKTKGSGERASTEMFLSPKEEKATFPKHTHLVPWAKVFYGFLGETGNMDQPLFNNEENNAMRAHALVGVTDESLDEDGGKNKNMGRYIAWINRVQERFVEHLVENRDKYSLLAQEFADIDDMTKGELKDRLMEMSHAPTRDKDDFTFVSAKAKLFLARSSREPLVYHAEMDREVWSEYGGVRNDIPVYGMDHERIPLDATKLYRNDVVGLEMRMRPLMWRPADGNLSISLVRDLKSVVVLERAELIPLDEVYDDEPHENKFI